MIEPIDQECEADPSTKSGEGSELLAKCRAGLIDYQVKNLVQEQKHLTFEYAKTELQILGGTIISSVLTPSKQVRNRCYDPPSAVHRNHASAKESTYQYFYCAK